MTVTDLRPAESWAEQQARAALVDAQTEALRAKTRAAREAADLAQRAKAAKAAAEIAQGEAEATAVREQAAAELAEKRRQRAEQDAQRAKVERSSRLWHRAALTLAVVCALVSLPLQILAFYSHRAPFLVLAPLVIEGVAWAMLAGAQAAIDEDRPSWHYRLLALLGALFAASVNFMHGSTAFGLATGLGGAFCSLAGPMVWDLHEHGRIAKREGRPTRRQRKEAARQQAEQAAAERQAAEQAAAAERAAEADRRQVEQDREQHWPDAWARAVALAAAYGEVRVSEPVWRRAWEDIYGAESGYTAEILAARNIATAAVRELGAQAASAAKREITPPVPPPAKAPEKRPQTRPGARVGSSAAMSAGARRAAAVTAREVEQDPAAAEDQREAARALYLAEAATGNVLSGAKLAARFGRGKTWGLDRIAEATAAA